MKKFAGDIVILHMCTKNHNHMSGIFPSTFLQPLNSSKNSILNGVTKLNLLMFFFFFVFETPLKDSHSIRLFFLLFGLDTYKHA